MKEITKESILELPLIQFDGKIIVIDNVNDIPDAVAKLSKESILGFDTEKKPTFKKGEYNYVSLLQLSTHKEAYLFQLSKTGLHRSLKLLMEDVNILKLGVAIRDDLIDLQKLSHFDPDGFLDLGIKAKDLEIPHHGLRKLAAFLLDSRLCKAQQTSNWENHPLTEAQQIYAATDAWVALKIYDEMKKLNPSKFD